MPPGGDNKLYQMLGRMEGNIEAIMKYIEESRHKDDLQDARLGKLETKVFFVWLIGPVLIGVLGFFDQIKTFLGLK